MDNLKTFSQRLKKLQTQLRSFENLKTLNWPDIMAITSGLVSEFQSVGTMLMTIPSTSILEPKDFNNSAATQLDTMATVYMSSRPSQEHEKLRETLVSNILSSSKIANGLTIEEMRDVDLEILLNELGQSISTQDGVFSNLLDTFFDG